MHRMGQRGPSMDCGIACLEFWGAELVAGEEIGAREHGGVAGEGDGL